MYKIGVVTEILGIDRSTVYNWVNKYESFFSDGARKLNRTQREFNDDDLAILNTIRHLRSDDTDWDQIRDVLDSGHRITDFPQSAVTMDSRVISVPHAEKAAEVMALQAALEEKEEVISELRSILKNRESAIEELHGQWRTEVAELNEKWRSEVSALNRLIGKLESQIEQYRELLANKKPDE